jgi:hypothetical protein
VLSIWDETGGDANSGYKVLIDVWISNPGLGSYDGEIIYYMCIGVSGFEYGLMGGGGPYTIRLVKRINSNSKKAEAPHYGIQAGM